MQLESGESDLMVGSAQSSGVGSTRRQAKWLHISTPYDTSDKTESFKGDVDPLAS